MTELSTTRSTIDEAQRRVDRIRGHVASAWEEVITAYKHRDHEVLGYGSGQAGWDAYILGEFGESRLSLPKHQRVEHVVEASDAGMSNRAIASAAGVTEGTVRNDLRDQVRKNYAPEPAGQFDADGNRQTWTNPRFLPDGLPKSDSTISTREGVIIAEQHHVDARTGEILDDAPPARTITGMDGKTYTQPQPKETAPRRPALNDQFFNAVFDMTKQIERVARLTEDDRFNQNKEKVAQKHLNDLLRSRDLLQQVIEQLN